MHNSRPKLITSPPKAFIFMKIGAHAGESLDDIMTRKATEIRDAGRSFWGYGGATCHPINQVAPFAQSFGDEELLLLMESVYSVADPAIVPAKQYSTDGKHWSPIPKGINVTGSRFALVLDEITPADFEVDLRRYQVAVGGSAGKSAADYLQGRVDKACLREGTGGAGLSLGRKIRRISFVGRVVKPFSVLVKGA